MSRLHRDIAALADGSYETPELRERVAASSELTALFEEQSRAVAAVRCARPSAPPDLRAALTNPARPAAAPRRAPMGGFAVACAAVLALAVVAFLQRGPGPPSVTTVALLAAGGASGPAPPADPSHKGALRSQLAGVRYPDWREAFGWQSSGVRTDRVAGRTTMTVYYANAGRAVDYTIVGGSPLREPAAASAQISHGTRFLGLSAGGRTIVTWRRDGHTCVVSATGVPLPTLLRLSEWRYDAAPA
ncbi:MAG: hypothetical protein ACR2KV_11165 [Solirubrobacteraceae bacterium]